MKNNNLIYVGNIFPSLSLFNKSCMLSLVQLFATPGTVALQTPLLMGFSRQEYWCRVPFPPPGDFPDLGIKALSPALAGRFFTPVSSGNPFNKSFPSLFGHFLLFSEAFCHVSMLLIQF